MQPNITSTVDAMIIPPWLGRQSLVFINGFRYVNVR